MNDGRMDMSIQKLLLKLLLSPVMLVLLLTEWIGIFLVSFGGTILYILSGIVFLIAIASGVLQTASAAEVLKMLVISFTVFIVPKIGEWCIGKVIMLRLVIGNCLHN